MVPAVSLCGVLRNMLDQRMRRPVCRCRSFPEKIGKATQRSRSVRQICSLSSVKKSTRREFHVRLNRRTTSRPASDHREVPRACRRRAKVYWRSLPGRLTGMIRMVLETMPASHRVIAANTGLLPGECTTRPKRHLPRRTRDIRWELVLRRCVSPL